MGTANLLAAALRPRVAAQVARLRRSEIALAGRAPAPMVLAVLGVGAKTGASTLATLVAQFLAAMSPGRVAVMDGDGAKQPQRDRLGAGADGDLAGLLASPQAWRSRRAIDRYVSHRGDVPLLAVAADAPRQMPAAYLEAAVRLLRHRYPCVVMDLPELTHELAARVADQVIVVGRLNWSLSATSRWLVANRPERAPGSVLTVAIGPDPSARLPEWVDMAFPTDAALGRPGPVRPGLLELPTQASVEEVICKLTRTWA